MDAREERSSPQGVRSVPGAGGKLGAAVGCSANGFPVRAPPVLPVRKAGVPFCDVWKKRQVALAVAAATATSSATTSSTSSSSSSSSSGSDYESLSDSSSEEGDSTGARRRGHEADALTALIEAPKTECPACKVVWTVPSAADLVPYPYCLLWMHVGDCATTHLLACEKGPHRAAEPAAVPKPKGKAKGKAQRKGPKRSGGSCPGRIVHDDDED